ncbi:DoxX family protein [Aestuariivirga litoralis]|uniref:DoxX family protein n=1 Tax=Aestuariivirga litoralis TaxID=2650924 RepID=UPI0018C81930|nr:DoxX family protein [Aestuariivirga litoralis]MBG1231439.1 DoxX family protein [Aestuariivirga litoralis]
MNSGIIPTSWQGPLQALLRVVTGLLFIEHGTVKLFAFPTASGMDSLPPLLMIAAILEVIGGILFTVGAFTRWVAFILAGQMAVAYFMAHFPQTFWPVGNGGEAAILFCFIFLFFAAAGAGPYSVDDSRK